MPTAGGAESHCGKTLYFVHSALMLSGQLTEQGGGSEKKKLSQSFLWGEMSRLLGQRRLFLREKLKYKQEEESFFFLSPADSKIFDFSSSCGGIQQGMF